MIVAFTRKIRLTAVLSAASILSVIGGSPQTAQAETKIIEGFVSNGALQWPEYIANEFGWFKENGVSVDMVVVDPGAAQQVAAGSLNIGYSGFPDFIRATNQGAPVKIIINAVDQPPYAVYAKPAIKKIADLKAKTVSIGGIKDVTLIYMEAFIASAGLKSSDVDLVYAKATQDRGGSLASNPLPHTRHLVTNVMVDSDGPEGIAAFANTQVIAFCEPRGQQILNGSYEYQLRREDQRFRIASKKVMLLEYVVNGYFNFFTV